MIVLENKKNNKTKRIIKKNLIAWTIALPSIALFLFFVFVPLLQNIIYSFQVTEGGSTSVSLENYEWIFSDDRFIASIQNTFIYILWSLVIGFLIPFIIGFLLSEAFHLKGLFRLIIYFPCMISGIAVVTLFKYFLDPDLSIINKIIVAFGGEPNSLTSDQNLVIPLIVLAMTWKGAGQTSLIYLSNFQQIDSSLYEASRIDGASIHQRFFHITIPQMKNTLITLFVLQIISVFQVFYEPWVISGGGPINSSVSMMLYAYEQGIMNGDVNRGAAASVILMLFILVFTLIYYAIVNLLNGKPLINLGFHRVKKNDAKVSAR